MSTYAAQDGELRRRDVGGQASHRVDESVNELRSSYRWLLAVLIVAVETVVVVPKAPSSFHKDFHDVQEHGEPLAKRCDLQAKRKTHHEMSAH